MVNEEDKALNKRLAMYKSNNVNMSKDGNILTIKIDLTKSIGESSKGKSILVASTRGNKEIVDGIRIGINAYVPI